ncbi:hypothetical protein PROFUN_08759 [Planoprotostelium fungivorum]|uniref:Uncharacterized protein n=1 Tax=Planoprotostelium fungivorum TaxID=1890364 RepID=A0A2P6ND94_9EUKA|nr:hypothetical protein PROFUN_08759 [Planoprotostelium fungivorum]
MSTAPQHPYNGNIKTPLYNPNELDLPCLRHGKIASGNYKADISGVSKRPGYIFNPPGVYLLDKAAAATPLYPKRLTTPFG